MSAVLLFHQGWTDIINSLGLIRYFSNKYEKLYLINRSDAEPLINFYSKQFTNVIPMYMSKETVDYFPHMINNISYNFNISEELKVLVNATKEYIGLHDKYRNDKYKNCFDNNTIEKVCFIYAFYNSYDIDSTNHILMFSIIRDLDLEKNKKNEIIKTNKPYILYHDTDEVQIKSEIIVDTNAIDLINLNQISYIFFDCIKLLEDSVEIHLIDSVWCAVCYLLDAKYGLFKNKKIYLYPKRGYYNGMFAPPYKLDNWIIMYS
jgi:hypothetical protein